MGRPLGKEPIPETYRQFLAVQIRRRALDKFGSTERFQQALAARGLHLETNQIYRWYLAVRFPDITYLRTIADVLEVTTDELLPPCPRHLRKTQFAVERKKPPKS